MDEEQRRGHWARVAQLNYTVIPQLEAELKQVSDTTSGTMLHAAVQEEDIADIISKSTGIPLTRLMEGEKQKLLKFEEVVGKRVVGQTEAVAAIGNAIRLSRVGLQGHNRTMGSFLFLGPTGVGKTELCKAAADFLFDHSNAMTRIDMSEYMERFSVSRLIGAPPGYIGYEEGGTLTEAVRRRPYQLVLFDEFEKAHRDVPNLLLQLLDEGVLTDSHGRKVDFRSTLVVLTSNLGAEIMANPERLRDKKDTIREDVMKVVKERIPPELLNRLDDVVMFNRLTKRNLLEIVDIETAKVMKVLLEKGVNLTVDNAVKVFLTKSGYDPVYGARPLRRVIRNHILNPLAAALLRGSLKAGQSLKAILKGSASVEFV